MRLVNIQGASSVQHPEHGTAEAGSDGVFELPEPFGRALVAQAAHWRTEADHIAQVSRKALEELASNPRRAAEVLHYVRGQITEQAEQIADLTQRLAALEQPATKTPKTPAK